MLSISTLRRLLRYDADTGQLYWRARPVSDFKDGGHTAAHNAAKWNAQFAGREAAGLSNGYRVLNIGGHQIAAHRVIWAMWHGRWPAGELDHEDRNRSHNRMGNLRDVTPGENMKNLPLRKTSKSGVQGVHWHARSRRWVAKIHVDGRTKHLGNFVCPAAASARRAISEREHGFHPNHGRAA